MGTHVLLISLISFVTFQTNLMQGIPPVDTCTNGTKTATLDISTRNSIMLPQPCRNDNSQNNDNSVWYLKLHFNPYPFDCSNNVYIQYTAATPGISAIAFCKYGSANNIPVDISFPSEVQILNENNETMFKLAGLRPNFIPQLVYIQQGAPLPGVNSINITYEFHNCPEGILNDTLECKPISTTTITTTPTSTTTATTKSTTLSTVRTTTPTTRTTRTTTATTSTTSTSASTTTRVNDGTFCAETIDQYPGSHIHWTDTEIGQTDTQTCPYNAEGTATRRCINDTSGLELHAVWMLPDLSGCISPLFKETLESVHKLLGEEYVLSETILGVTTGLANATKTSSEKTIFPGDLNAAAETIGILADVVGNIEAKREDLYHITMGCTEVLSNIVDPTTDTIWKFTKYGYLENKVTTILDSVERLSANIAQKHSDIMTSRERRADDGSLKSENTAVASQNLDLSIHVVNRATNFTRFVEEQDANDANGIVLPEEVFKRAVHGTSDPYVHLYYAQFSSIADLVKSTHSKINGQRNAFDSYVTSSILSSKVLNVNEELFEHLKTAVKITFSTQNTSIGVLRPKCVFLNKSATSNTDRWSGRGCVRSPLESDDNTTVCYCSHLTNFAVLMDIYDVENYIDEFDAKILTYLSYGGGGLSILGCLISIFVFEYFRLKNQRVRVHEQLAITIILVQLFFMVGIDRTENKYVCKVLAICLHYVLVAMFCWMLVEGAHLYLVLVKVFKSQSHMKKYVLIGWGVPLIIVGISAGIFHDNYGTGSVCWITHKVLLVAFIPAISLVIVINTVVLIVVMRIMFNSMSKGSKSAVEERSSVKSGLKAACVLLPLLGLTWTFGYLSITSRETLIFTYLFTFFNSMQGVFFFVFHCLLSVDVQNAYERHSRRKSQIRLTESSFSKRTRKGSEYESSEYSPGSRQSIKTEMTSAHSTLDKRIANQMREQSGNSRTHSVSFDDDVFVTSGDVIHERLHRRTSNGSYKDSNIGLETPRRNLSNSGNVSYNTDGRPNGHVLNNVTRGSRHNSETSDGYVLYFGNGTPVQKNDIQRYSSFDKNDLYATVQK